MEARDGEILTISKIINRGGSMYWNDWHDVNAARSVCNGENPPLGVPAKVYVLSILFPGFVICPHAAGCLLFASPFFFWPLSIFFSLLILNFFLHFPSSSRRANTLFVKVNVGTCTDVSGRAFIPDKATCDAVAAN